jgi:hypothetical protein
MLAEHKLIEEKNDRLTTPAKCIGIMIKEVQARFIGGPLQKCNDYLEACKITKLITGGYACY